METNDRAIRKLLQIKKLETPGTEYFDAFLDEFHRYQRSSLLRSPSVWETMAAFFRETFFAEPRRVLAWSGSFAAVFLFLALAVLQHEGSSHNALMTAQSHVRQSSAEADALSSPQPDLQMVSTSAFEQDFKSPRYVTGQTPLSYETAFAF